VSSVIQTKRRESGQSGKPSAHGASGELALNFSQGAISTELWAYSKTIADWVLINPHSRPPHVVTKISGTDAGSVEATFNQDLITVEAGEILIYVYEGEAYMYGGPIGSPVNGAINNHFTKMGSTVGFATTGDFNTPPGGIVGKAIDPNVLLTYFNSVTTSTGGTPGDADKFLALGANGVLPGSALPWAKPVDFTSPGTGAVLKAIDPAALLTYLATQKSAGSGQTTDAGKFLVLNGNGQVPSSALANAAQSIGTVDLTVAPSANFMPSPGNTFTVSKSGTAAGSGWTGIAGPVKAGDLVFYDGSHFHLFPGPQNMPYLPLAGGTMDVQAAIIFRSTTAGFAIIDGGSPAHAHIQNVTIDGGNY